MGNFQRGGDRGGRGGFGGGDRGGRGGDRGGFRGGDRGPVTMHRAVCGDCGNNCEVPFRPNGDRPVLCNDCFGGKRDGGDRGGRKDFGSREPKRDFNDRPSASFSKPTQDTSDLKKQLSEMNTKIERLVNMFEKFTKSVPQGEPVIKVKEEKVKTPGLKTVIKKAVAAETPVKKAVVKKTAAKKVAKKK